MNGILRELIKYSTNDEHRAETMKCIYLIVKNGDAHLIRYLVVEQRLLDSMMVYGKSLIGDLQSRTEFLDNLLIIIKKLSDMMETQSLPSDNLIHGKTRPFQ